VIFSLGVITIAISIIYLLSTVGWDNDNWYWYQHRYFKKYADLGILIGLAMFLSGYAGYVWFGRIEKRNGSSSDKSVNQ